MSDIDLKALREAANRSMAAWGETGARDVGDDVSLDAGAMISLLDRLEAAEGCRASIASSSLALVQRAETAEKERDALRADKDRAERNRDMWKGQCERQAQQISQMREDVVRELVVAMSKERGEA